MLKRRGVILAKVEANYGVDPTPTVAANALLVSDISVKPVGALVERDFLKSSLSQLQFVRGEKYVDISFKTEIKGTGTRGVLPAWGWEGDLIQGCGFAETVNAATSIVWAPASSSLKSTTLYVYQDGIYHKILGCRGSVKFNCVVGKYIEAEWKFQGLYNAPADATPAAQTFSSVLPQPVLSAGFTIGAYAAILEKLEIDMGVELAIRKSMNAATGIVGVEITGRKPQGSCDPEVVTEATYAFWNKWELATAVALNFGPIGATSGNIVTITAPKVQQREVSYGDRSGQLTYQIPLAFAMNAGDDEITITIT